MLITLKKVISQAEQVLFSHQPSAGALQEIFHFSPAANNQKSIKEIKNFLFEGNETSVFWTLDFETRSSRPKKSPMIDAVTE